MRNVEYAHLGTSKGYAARFRRVLTRIPLFSLLLAGCSPEPPPKISDLHFPVTVLYTNSSTRLFDSAADLDVMSTQLVINSSQSPVLVDSEFNIYTLEKLRSVHGGLWLMVHPVGNTEVAFDLKRTQNSGLDAARLAIGTQLDTQTWRNDIERRHKTLATKTTLTGMLELLRDEAE